MSVSPYTIDELEDGAPIRGEYPSFLALAGKTVARAGWIDGWPFLFFTDGSHVHFSGYEEVNPSVHLADASQISDENPHS